MKKPEATKIAHEITQHGHTRLDNYHWLEDKNDSKVMRYLKEENKYTDAVMEETLPLQQKLVEEMMNRKKAGGFSEPFFLRGYWYYKRNHEGKEYPIYCRRGGCLTNVEEIILDVNELAEGKEYCRVYLTADNISPDNQMICYTVDYSGEGFYTICFKDLVSGCILDDELYNSFLKWSCVWSLNGEYVIYTIKDLDSKRPDRVVRHRIGTDTKDDEEVYRERDEGFYCYLSSSTSNEYFFILSCSDTSEYRYLKKDNPLGKFSVIQSRIKDHFYNVDHVNGSFYFRTNLGAPNFKMVRTTDDKPGKEHWQEIVAEQDNVFIEEFVLLNNHIVLYEKSGGFNKLRVVNVLNDTTSYIPFPEQANSICILDNVSADSEYFYFSYQSFTRPETIYSYHLHTKELAIVSETSLCGFEKENYKTEVIYAISADGKQIPISLVYKKDMKRKGGNPLLLHGYGASGYSLTQEFSAERLSLLDRGFIYAIAHIRGGSEMGKSWHNGGRLLHKKNTFKDFIACTEYLIDQDYSNKDNLFTMGESSGGLLMGAIANMRPDLYKGIIADIPIVDLLSWLYQRPSKRWECSEFGDPRCKKYYQYLLSYSPYENVGIKDYPAMLVLTGLNDLNTEYWGPVKWTAKLRDIKTDNNDLLLKVNMHTGHGGVTGAIATYKEMAFRYAFMMKQVGKSS